MTGTLLLVAMIAPLAAAAGCLLTRAARVAEVLNLIASLIVFAAAIPLAVLSAGGPYHIGAAMSCSTSPAPG